MFGGKLLKCGTVAAAAIFALSTAVSAATLSVIGGSQTTLPNNFDAGMMSGPAPLPAVGDPITDYSGADPFAGGTEGLYIDSTTNLTFTYMGKEAAATNTASQFGIGGQSLSNKGAVGSSITVWQTGPGFVNFVFTTLEGLFEDINGNSTTGESLSIANGIGSAFAGLHIAFGNVFNNGQSVLVFFGDGRGDSDFDDMVVRIDVTAVPLPAAGLLLLGALGGLGAVRSRRKQAA